MAALTTYKKGNMKLYIHTVNTLKHTQESMHTHTHTHIHTHTHTITNSLTHSLIHSLTHSLTHTDRFGC